MVLFKKTKQEKTVFLTNYKKDHNIVFDTIFEDQGVKLLIFRLNIDQNICTDDMFYSYNLVDFTYYQNCIYLIYNIFGKVTLDQYHIDNRKIIFIRKYPIGNMNLLSYANGGQVISSCESKWITASFFFFLDIKQIVGPSLLKGLFVFRSDKIFKIDFNQKHTKKIKILRISSYGNNWYEEYLKEKPSTISVNDENHKRYLILSKFYNKPYEYWLSQQKEMPFFSEESFLRNLGLEKLPLFSLNEDGILSSNKLKLAEESLKHILSTYCKQKNNPTFKLIEYIYSQERDHKLYFFYYYGSFNLKIAVFNIRENEWIIDDYNELECEIG